MGYRGRPYKVDPERPGCTAPGCPAPAALAYARVVKDGTRRDYWRKVCSFHQTHPLAAAHPLTVRVEHPPCPVPGCPRQVSQQADESGTLVFLKTCAQHRVRDLVPINPHVQRELKALPPTVKAAAGVKKTDTGQYVVRKVRRAHANKGRPRR